MPAPQTKEIKVHYRKSTAFWMGAGVVFLLLFSNFLNVNIIQDIENKSIDFRFGVRGPRTPEAPVYIVAVDDKSLEEVGRWPWPRTRGERLSQKLKKVGVKVAFSDVVFAEPDRAQEDMLKQLGPILNSSIKGSSKTTSHIREKVLSDIKSFAESQNGDKDLAQA